MIIEIDDDCLSEIIKGVLVKDYIYITRDLKSPKNWHEEDIQAFKEASEAIKKLGNWYFAHGEFEKAVKAARKKK